MQLKQFEYFVTCADCGSYGKASKVLFTTQANISKVIRQMEEEVGYKVFERTGAGVTLTSQGKDLYDKASQVLEIVSGITLGNVSNNMDSLKIASNPSNILSRLFVDFVEQNREQCGNIVFTEDGTMAILDTVMKGNADIGFIYVEDYGKSIFPDLLKRDQLQFTKIADAQLVLTVGRHNPLYHQEELTVQMLQEQRYIKLCEDAFMRDYHLQRVIKELGLTRNMNEAMRTNSDYVAKYALENTSRVQLSYSFFFKPPWMLDIKEFSLEPLLKEVENRITLGYVKKSDKILNPLNQKFIEKVRMVIRSDG